MNLSLDNKLQLCEIEKYRERLERILGRRLDSNIAARIWIRKYAHLWRLRNSSARACANSAQK